MIKTNTIVKKSKNSIESEIDGDVVLMNLENNEYYSMNQVGSLIWGYLDKAVLVKDIVTNLMEKFDVTEKQCTEDTLRFLNELHKRKIIETID